MKKISFNFLANFLALLIILLTLSCSSNSPVPYGTESLFISAGKHTIYSHGDQTTIYVSMYKEDGMPVLDNTRVLLKCDAGYLTDNEILLKDGKGETTFISDAYSGDVKIYAQSGTVGADGSIFTTINVEKANLTPSSLVMNTTPSTIGEKGDSVQITVYCYNSDNQLLKNQQIILSTSFGILNSNGNPLITDEDGKVSDILLINESPAGIDKITVKAECGSVSATLDIGIIHNIPPSVDFSFSPTSPQVNETVNFYSSCYDEDGTITEIQWLFGDGYSSNSSNPSHVYAKAGDYIVRLVATDNKGTSVFKEKTITVSNGNPPVAQFTATPEQPKNNQTVVFDASSSYDTDGSIVSYEWNFGYGFTDTGITVNHVFPTAGVYSVTLKVTDNNGNYSLLNKNIEVSGNLAPDGSIVFSPQSPKIGESVYFSSENCYDPDGTIKSYKWYFGDGYTSTEQNPSHSYQKEGTFNVQLVIKDNENASTTLSTSITVGKGTPPEAVFTYSPSNPARLHSVYFNAIESTDADGNIVSYSWDFGDGSQGSGQKISHIFQESGEYIVTLTVRDNDGLTGISTKNITVANSPSQPPQISLSITPETVTTSTGEVILNASETTDDNTQINDLIFNFVITTAEPESGNSVLTVQLINTNTPAIKKLLITGAESGDIINIFLTVYDSDNNYSTLSKDIVIE